MTLLWPIGAFYRSVRVIAGTKSQESASSSPRDLLDMYWMALRHSIPPLEYSVYGLNRPQARRDIHQYVYWNDMPALVAINARRGADNRDVQDKDRFAEICVMHGLPHVPTLAVFEQERQTYPKRPYLPDAPTIWSKALRLKGGVGGTKWTRFGDLYRSSDGRRLTACELAGVFRRQDCIVQPFVENHPAIAPITNGALATIRIVTGMNASGKAVFVTSLLSLPREANETSVGGIICSIDRESGRLVKAANPDGTAVTHHPDTDSAIAGTLLPLWHEAVNLVRHAHAVGFPHFAFLGWDVALTEDGPVLLETNSGWGALFHQMLDGPLGHTEFARLVGQYV